MMPSPRTPPLTRLSRSASPRGSPSWLCVYASYKQDDLNEYSSGGLAGRAKNGILHIVVSTLLLPASSGLALTGDRYLAVEVLRHCLYYGCYKVVSLQLAWSALRDNLAD
ncbi:hypothetical protein CC2G_005988 [Coprinopsis cinerea AmutBmut pab1-1]|nr:hypothetical protein CC2G_005988 [Coprinopsis cinerea AmutBmut pab1-1]